MVPTMRDYNLATILPKRYPWAAYAPFECFLPLPVTQNQALKVARGRLYDSAESVAWEEYVHMILYSFLDFGMPRTYRAQPEKVGIIIYSHVKGLYDSDGGLKKLFDVLEGHAYAKDDQVWHHIYMRQPWREDSIEHMHVIVVGANDMLDYFQAG